MIRIRFKEAYTANTRCYNIQKNLSYEIFVSTLHPLITVDFQTNDYNMVDVDYRLIHKHFRGASEEAPNIFWFDIYNKYRNLCALRPPFMRGPINPLLNELAFYIKKKDNSSELRSPEFLRFSPTQASQRVSGNSSDNECMICYESSIHSWNPYGCNHLFCRSCIENCVIFNHTRCPICRIPGQGSLNPTTNFIGDRRSLANDSGHNLM
jgi:hypothetical protein